MKLLSSLAAGVLAFGVCAAAAPSVSAAAVPMYTCYNGMRFQSFILAPAGYLDLRAEGCDVPSAADDTDNILGHGDKGKIFTPVKFRAADTGVTVLCDAGSDTADSLNRKVYAFTTKDRGTMRTSGYCKRI